MIKICLKELRNQYQKINEGVPIEKKIFSVRILKQQLNSQKQENMQNIDNINFKLLPHNYVENKEQIIKKKKNLQNTW